MNLIKKSDTKHALRNSNNNLGLLIYIKQTIISDCEYLA